MQNLSGRKLGNYELRERLGRGGMAEVYKAYQSSMDRFVAVKVMLGHLADDENFIERFKREAQAVGRLRHPHIIQIFDFGIQDDVYYMAMEYVTGGNLKEHIVAKQKLPLTESLKIAHDLASALIYAHASGMIHRDLKPANVMFIDEDAQDVVLTDFGIARILGATGITGSGMSVGTPSYMSPEAGQGEDIDERADIYALGIILYEMLVGTVPYDADTPLAVIMKHIAAPLPTRADYGEHIPEVVEKIVLKCLAKDREDRYASATELRDALADVLQIAPNIAKTEAVQAPQAETEVVSVDAANLEDDVPTTMVSSAEMKAVNETRSGRNPLLTYGIAGVIVLAILGGLYLAFGGSGAVNDTIEDTPVPEVALSVEETPELDEVTTTDTPTEMLVLSATPMPTATQVPLTLGGFQPPNAHNLSLLTNISDMMDTADSMVLAGDLEGAIEYVSNILQDDPDHASALFARAELYSLRQDDENLARQDAERLIELQPDSPLGYIALHDSWLNYPALEDAYAVDNARSAIEQAYELEPENPHVLWRLASIGDWELERERMISAQNLGARGYRYIRSMGEFLYNTADYEAAIPYLEVFMRGTEPDTSANQQSFWNLLGALIQVGESQAALETLLESGIIETATHYEVFGAASRVAYEAQDLDLAQEWSVTALALSPEAYGAIQTQGLLAWTRDGDYETALNNFNRLAEMNVSLPFPTFGTVTDLSIDRARMMTQAERYEEAIDYYTIAIENELYRPFLYEERAEVYLLLEQIESAQADFREAFTLETDPELRAYYRERLVDLDTTTDE